MAPINVPGKSCKRQPDLGLSKESAMSGKTSVMDHIPVFSIVKTAAETIARNAGAEDRDARLLDTIAGACASIFTTAVRS
jgi:hypothetical protein